MAPALTPQLIDAILAALVLELLAVGAWLRWARATRWVLPWSLFLASGGALMLALRGALAGSPASFLSGALLASGVCHLGTLAWLVRHRAQLVPDGGR